MRHLTEKELVSLVFGDLAPERRVACFRHAADCEKCHAALDGLERAVSVLRAPISAGPPPFAWSRLQARIERSGKCRDWNEPDWVPLIAGHAGGIVLATALIAVLGAWLESAPLWQSLRVWAFVRQVGPHGLVALLFFGVGALITLAVAPVLWWEMHAPRQRIRNIQ